MNDDIVHVVCDGVSVFGDTHDDEDDNDDGDDEDDNDDGDDDDDDVVVDDDGDDGKTR